MLGLGLLFVFIIPVIITIAGFRHLAPLLAFIIPFMLYAIIVPVFDSLWLQYNLLGNPGLIMLKNYRWCRLRDYWYPGLPVERKHIICCDNHCDRNSHRPHKRTEPGAGFRFRYHWRYISCRRICRIIRKQIGNQTDKDVPEVRVCKEPISNRFTPILYGSSRELFRIWHRDRLCTKVRLPSEGVARFSSHDSVPERKYFHCCHKSGHGIGVNDCKDSRFVSKSSNWQFEDVDRNYLVP